MNPAIQKRFISHCSIKRQMSHTLAKAVTKTEKFVGDSSTRREPIVETMATRHRQIVMFPFGIMAE